MSVSIGTIMELPSIHEKMRLMAGRGGLDREISFVTIMEAPDFYEWVSGGEFVLTTWYAFSKQPDMQNRAFIELAKRGIAGMGIKVNRFVPAIPREILDIADEYKLPVFAVNFDTKFREIMQAIYAELNNYQTNILIEVDKHYQELVGRALEENGFDPLLRAFGRRRNCQCFCITNDYKTLGAYNPFLGPSREEEIKQKLADYVQENGDIIVPAFFDGMHVFPCMARGYSLGYFVVNDRKALNESFLLMAQQLTTFLTLKFLDRVDTEQKMLTALLDDILFKHDLNEVETRERLKLFGLRTQGNLRALVISSYNKTPILQNSKDIHEHSQKIKSLIGDALLIEKYDEIVLLASCQAGSEDRSLIKWLKPLLQYVREHAPEMAVSIGPAVAAARDFGLSYGMAKRTLAVGMKRNCSAVLYFMDYLVQSYLFYCTETPETPYLMKRVIRPIVEQDGKYTTELLKTLETILFTSGLEQAAASLHIHVNTLRYRIRKIRDLTGLDYFVPMERYSLTTAFLQHNYRGQQE